MGCGTKKIDTLARHRPSAAASAHSLPQALAEPLLSPPCAAMKRIHDENNERGRKIGIKGVGSRQANTTLRMTCSKTLVSNGGNQHAGRGLRVAAGPRQDKAEGRGENKENAALCWLCGRRSGSPPPSLQARQALFVYDRQRRSETSARVQTRTAR